MTILFLTPTISYSGAEKVRNWLAKQIHFAGHCVIYAMPKDCPQLFEEMKSLGLDEFAEPMWIDYRQKFLRPLRYIRTLYSQIKARNVDLFVVFGGSLFDQIAARRAGAKVLLSERWNPASRNWFSQIIKRIEYKTTDGCVFQTPEAASWYGGKAEQGSVVIPNPIIDNLGEPQFDNLRKEVVTVGRLSAEKNQEMLLCAFAEFHKTHTDYTLTIYGDGPLKEFLQTKAKSLQIADSVSIVSGKRNISEVLKGASLFVLPSNTEGMPNALIEAMSMGVLSIATDCPIYGARMLVKHAENAYLAPVNDARALANLMSLVLDDEQKADSVRHEAVKIRETLDGEKIFARWTDYMSSLRK